MPLQPIPTPPGQQWYEFKLRQLPVIVFCVVLLLTLVTWKRYLSVSSFVGEVETLQVQACSPVLGVVAELKVRAFQQVTAGQEVGRVVSSDPKAAGVIVAPIEGNVTYIYHQPGEKIKLGEPLMTISGPQADRIVAFLRQPIRVDLHEGQPVLIEPRARSGSLLSTIQKVGPELAPIRPSLLPAAQGREELGQPMIIGVPAGVKMFPGEIVDLKLLPMPAAAPAKPAEPAKPVEAPKPAVAAAPPAPAPAPDPAPFSPDDEGFIRNWLVLPSIDLGPQIGSHEEKVIKPVYDKEYFPNQNKATPKAGDKVKVADKELEWKVADAGNSVLDLVKVCRDAGKPTDNCLVLGVCYILAAEDLAYVKLKTGSDDDDCWRLNDAEVIRFYGGRGLAKDQDTKEGLTLKKGWNILRFGIINGSGEFAGCARFLDKDNKPLRNIKIGVVPPPAK